MITLRITTNFIYLEGIQDSLAILFNKALRFRPKNWFFAKRRRRGWNGWVSFYNLDKNRVPTGLLPEIIKVLNNLKADYKIVDERQTLPNLSITSDILGNGIVLHDYQVDLANIALEQKRGIIKAPTGSGKTLIFTSILKALGELPTVVLFRNKTLVDQTYRVFSQFGLERIGRVHMGVFDPNVITCSTIQSIHKIKPLIPLCKCLIMDECHEFTSNKSVRTIKVFEKADIRLGFSATPFKRDDPIHNYKLKSWLGPILVDLPTSDLQERGILSQSIAYFHKVTEPKGIHGLPWPFAEDKGIVENESFHRQIAELVAKINKGRVMILVRRIAHGDALARHIPGAFWISGQDNAETRDYVLGQLRSSKQEKVVAICSSICNVGVDVFIHYLINAGGGKEPNITIQKMGRGLRLAPDKDKLEYHDFIHQTNRYLEAHSMTRIKTLKQEGHQVIEG